MLEGAEKKIVDGGLYTLGGLILLVTVFLLSQVVVWLFTLPAIFWISFFVALVGGFLTLLIPKLIEDRMQEKQRILDDLDRLSFVEEELMKCVNERQEKENK